MLFMPHKEKIFWLKYPPLYVLLPLIVAGYLIFTNAYVVACGASLGLETYFVSFISGILFASGIAAPFGAGLWSVLVPQNFLAGIICGALGGIAFDLLILNAIKTVIQKTNKEVVFGKAVPVVKKVLTNPVGSIFVPGVVFMVVGFVSVIPFPHKLGNILVYSVTKLKKRKILITGLILYSITATFFIGLKYALPIIANAFGLA